MITYDLPEEPDQGPLWGPTPDGEGWVEYWKSTATGLWYPAKAAAGGERLSWGGLLMRGPLVDEDPRITLEVLADALIGAALEWRSAHRDGLDSDYKLGARDDLNRAIDRYLKKLEQR